MNVILPLLSTIVSFIFAATVFAQWLSRHKPHQMVWTLGFVFYGIGAGCELIGSTLGWNAQMYQLWYLTGAILVAAYLGMGTVYLISVRTLANVIMAVLVLGSLYAIFKVAGAQVNLTSLAGMKVPTSEAMPNDVRLLTPIFNIYGTLGLVGGAAYSAWIFWSKRILPQRMVSCILIAVGGILPAIGGTAMRLGNPELFFLMEFLGVAVIFLGFLANSEIVATRLTARQSTVA